VSFDLAAYLARIGLETVSNDVAGLRALQDAHIRSVPFENFDPLLGKVPELAPAAVFDKIVTERRGGYCFEQNGLFGAALAAAGFAPWRLLARVRMRFGPEAARSHLVLLVNIAGETWLTDAGFGGPGSLAPLRLEPGEQTNAGGTYRLTEDAERGETVLERLGEDGWLQLYAFDRARVTDGEIASANHFCATWDQAPFGFHLVVGGYAGDLRYGLFDRQLSVAGPAGVEQRELQSAADLAGVADKLGLTLNPAALEAAWARIAG
jgi:N-hydroxyarylamine O-acetyltransferase